MAPQEQPDVATMLYMIKTLEQQLAHVQDQLKSFVPIRENELQLQNIQATVSRIERDVIAMKAKQEAMEREARIQNEQQKAAQADLDREMRTRDEQQKEAQSALQIRVLVSIVSFVVLTVGSVITAFLTHYVP